MSKKKQSLVKADPNKDLVLASFEEDAGAGFENADSDCYAIPYLVILQKGSPQCDPDSGSFIDGARPGMLLNNVTNEVFDGDVEVVPVTMSKLFVEWGHRDAGGGFKGTYKASDPIVQKARNSRDDSGRLCLENGNYLADTRYHFCLFKDSDGNWRPIVMSLTSTQIKKSRNWMTAMQNIQFRKKDGTPYTAPMYSHVYRVSTKAESNEKGSWRGWIINLERCLDPASNEDRDVIMSARHFKGQLAEGNAQIVQTDADPNAANNNDDLDF